MATLLRRSARRLNASASIGPADETIPYSPQIAAPLWAASRTRVARVRHAINGPNGPSFARASNVRVSPRAVDRVGYACRQAGRCDAGFAFRTFAFVFAFGRCPFACFVSLVALAMDTIAGASAAPRYDHHFGAELPPLPLAGWM